MTKKSGKTAKTSARIEGDDHVALIKTIVQTDFPSPVAGFVQPDTRSAAQAYADRVWAGQSESADRAWRVERVRLALEGQNLPFEGVVLP